MSGELLSSDPSAGYKGQIELAAREAGLDPVAVARLVSAESGWNPSAKSPKGALGLMQLMPATAKDYGVTDLLNPSENIKAGIAHLKRLSEKYDGDWTKIAAAYNAGEGRVDQAGGGVPAIPETQKYVAKVAPPQKPGGLLSSDPSAGLGGGNGLGEIPDEAPQPAPEPTLWDKVVSRINHPIDTAADLAVGGAKFLGEQATNAGAFINRNSPLIRSINEKLWGLTPEQQAAAFPDQVSRLQPSNTVQKIGREVTKAAEYVVPMGAAAKVGTKIAGPTAGLAKKVLAQAVTAAPVSAGVAATQGDNPTTAAALGAVTGAAGPIIDAVAPALRKGATSLMTNYVKPTARTLKDMPGGVAVGVDEQAKRLSEYILNKQLSPKTALQLTKQLQQRVDDEIAKHGGVVTDAAQSALTALQDLKAKVLAGPLPDVAPVNAAIEKLSTGSLFEDVVLPNGQRNPNWKPGGPKPVNGRIPRQDVTVAEAEQARTALGPQTRTTYGQTQATMSPEAVKAVKNALSSSVKQVPEIAAVRAEQPMAITANKALQHAQLLESKRMPVSPFTMITGAAGLAGGFGPAEVLAVASHILHRYPRQTAQFAFNLSKAIEAKNIPLVAKFLSRVLPTLAPEDQKDPEVPE